MFETGFHVGYALGRGAKTSADSCRLPYAIDKEVFFGWHLNLKHCVTITINVLRSIVEVPQSLSLSPGHQTDRTFDMPSMNN